jgi:DNA polymerase
MRDRNPILRHLRQLAESEPELYLPRAERALTSTNAGAKADANADVERLATGQSALSSASAQASPAQFVVELAALAKTALACALCPLHETRHKVVFGVGDAHARLMFVGEAPGADEDAQGEPFVGRAGQLLNKILTAMKLRRSEVYIANVLKCRPPGNRNPLPGETATCMPYLRKQIELINPAVVVALGAVAAVHLLKLAPDVAVKSLRGRIFNLDGRPLIVTYHPAALLRNPSYKTPTWEDMQTVLKVLSGELKWQPENKPFTLDN